MNDKYLKFEKEDDAIEWMYNNYKNFLFEIQNSSNVDGTLGDALFSYTGNMSKDYNEILRLNNGNIIDIEIMIDKYYNSDNNDYIENTLNSFFVNEAKNDIKLMYDAFSLNVIKENIILFHYFNINNFGKKILNQNSFMINKFISTTVVEKSSGIKELINKRNYDSVLIIKQKMGLRAYQ